MGDQAHWDAIYSAKGATELSWSEERPTTSLRLIDGWAEGRGRVLDAGGGRSGLAEALVAEGWGDVVVLDLSARAVAGLDEAGGAVRAIVGDVLDVKLPSGLEVWHDRAAFHFLVAATDQAAYAARAASSVRPGGIVVLGCFGPEGPERCSGLTVARHGAAELAERFGAAFELVHDELVVHETPWGATQQFCWVVLRRR
jgi:SAM-dependent methyltransferase